MRIANEALKLLIALTGENVPTVQIGHTVQKAHVLPNTQGEQLLLSVLNERILLYAQDKHLLTTMC